MSTAELKTYIHQRVDTIEDVEILGYVKNILESPTEVKPELILTAQQISRIDEAKRQLADGQFYTEEQANTVIEKWLSE